VFYLTRGPSPLIGKRGGDTSVSHRAPRKGGQHNSCPFLFYTTKGILMEGEIVL
jgi:hypothetical protein